MLAYVVSKCAEGSTDSENVWFVGGLITSESAVYPKRLQNYPLPLKIPKIKGYKPPCAKMRWYLAPSMVF